MEKLGVGYEHLRVLKPDIIVLEMPAFGHSGPMSGYAALGPTMEMAAGRHYFDSEEVLIANGGTPVAHFYRSSIYATAPE